MPTLAKENFPTLTNESFPSLTKTTTKKKLPRHKDDDEENFPTVTKMKKEIFKRHEGNSPFVER